MAYSKLMMEKKSLLRLYLFIADFVTLFTVLRLALIPADPKNAVWLGYSLTRLILIAGAVLISLIFIGLTFTIELSQTYNTKLIKLIDQGSERNVAKQMDSICLAIIVSVIFIHLIPAQSLGDRADQLVRLIPLLDLAMLIAVITILLLFLWRGGYIDWKRTTSWRDELNYAAVAAAVLLILCIFIFWTRLGINPDRSGWYAPGTPILVQQVFLALGVSIVIIKYGFTAVQRLIPDGLNWKGKIRFDYVLCVGLWLSACLVWWLEPMRKPSYFSPTPVPPNYERYPYSDGAEYDGYAQELLIGKGDEMGLIRRPLYAYFLAGLHGIVGQDYDALVSLQIAVLALIPPLMYLLAFQLSNRMAGLVAAILVILRERNSIALANVIEVSHSKLLLSELPAMGLILLLCLLVVRWLSDPYHEWSLAVAAGGVMGLLAMIRSQSFLLVPFLMICVLSFHRSGWRQKVKGLGLFILGLAVTISPWMLRSYHISGRLDIEDTNRYIDLFASGYTFTPYESITALPGESVTGHYNRMVEQIFRFISEHPDEVARFFSSHFFHNEISKVLYLPMTMSLFNLRTYVNQMGYWKVALSSLSAGGMVMLFVNLALISLGLGAAFKKVRFLTIIPVMISVAYSLSVIPARLSSGRFILPADWVAELFYSIGLVQLVVIIYSLSTNRMFTTGTVHNPGIPRNGADRTSKSALIISILIFIGLGIGFAVLPRLIPMRYPRLNQDQIIHTYLQADMQLENGVTVTIQQVREFLAHNKDAILMVGGDLYPRFYKAGDYWGDENVFNLEARKIDRMQFDLIGPQPGSILLPLQTPPDSFPQAVSVLVLGCSHDYGIRAILVMDIQKQLILPAAPWPGLSCQTPSQQ